MKELQIRMLRGQFATIDAGDYATVAPHGWYLNGGYPVARIEGRLVYLHVLLVGKAPRGYHIDHINRNKLDNRRQNLRIVTAAENIRNRRTYLGSANPFHGKRHSAHLRAIVAARWSKAVIQIDLNGKVIKVWGSAMEAQRELGISNGNISSVVNGQRQTAGGFKWTRP